MYKPRLIVSYTYQIQDVNMDKRLLKLVVFRSSSLRNLTQIPFIKITESAATDLGSVVVQRHEKDESEVVLYCV